MIQGLWGECKGITYEPYKEKPNKYKLIEVLNKIANGELKEGTKVRCNGYNYEYRKLHRDSGKNTLDLYSEHNASLINTAYLTTALSLEVELIEPHHIRDDTKIIEPTDNTTEKIKELKQLDMDFAEIDFSSHEEYARCAIQVLARKMTKQIDKLNEVIRKLNKGDNNE